MLPKNLQAECVGRECDTPWWQHVFFGTKLSGWFAAFVSFLIAYGFGLALLKGLSVYRRLQHQELQVQLLQRQGTEAQLSALKMQLSPHTLFNLLHTIHGQIAWDPPLAQRMAVQLGDLLRKLLSAGDRAMQSVHDELRFVSLYLELQQQRFADRLTIALPDITTLPAAQVPTLILQPLIENAVTHGVEGHTGPVCIELAVEKQGEQLIIVLENTVAVTISDVQPGIRIAKVRERLAVQFGERASLESARVGTSTWRARLTMPYLA
jgi:LytS/YehU family sensor histidine kinase